MQSLSRDYKEETILFSKVVKIVRNESRHNIPLTNNLMSVIFKGLNYECLKQRKSETFKIITKEKI